MYSYCFLKFACSSRKSINIITRFVPLLVKLCLLETKGNVFQTETPN